SANWRIMPMRACSEPPPSAVGCTERMRLVRVAVNAEQLLYRSPGGVGRYTAQLLTLLPEAFPGDEVVPFVARHGREPVMAAMSAAGASETTANSTLVLDLPRPILYE